MDKTAQSVTAMDMATTNGEVPHSKRPKRSTTNYGVDYSTKALQASGIAGAVLQPKKRARSTAHAQSETVAKENGRSEANQGSIQTYSATSSKSKSRKAGSGKTKYQPPRTTEAVHDLLKALGVRNPKKVSSCLKAGILHGYVKLLPPEKDTEKKFGLDQVLLTSKCPLCDKKLTCKVKDALYQSDFGGDYECGSEGASFRCRGCCKLYVTEICYGDPGFECGKFHNHCTECPMFGECIGDYREMHCKKCGNHYHGTFGMFPCYHCEGGSDSGSGSESED